MNQTAYRILQLLLWLTQEPLTFDQINDRFKTMGHIAKTVSQDSLWLYLNTLKALDCKVSRSTRSNGFRYNITHHPFNYYLGDVDINALKGVLSHLDHHENYWDMIHLNRWLKKVFDTISNADKAELSARFFEESRLILFDGLEDVICQLEHYAKQHQLLQIAYQSPVHGKETFIFLPQKIFFYQGALYLSGHRWDQDRVSMLRIDKIEAFEAHHNADIYETLIQRQRRRQLFIFRLFHCAPQNYVSMSEDEKVMVDPTDPNHLVIRLRTDNDFLLKQKLLSSEYPFQILYPSPFKQEMDQTLEQMRQLYLV